MDYDNHSINMNLHDDSILTFARIKKFLDRNPREKTFVIDPTYKSIEDYAFSENEHPVLRQIKKVIFNTYITEVPRCCFYLSKSIEIITLSKSVKSIGESSFYGCSNLLKIDNTEGIEKIGFVAFKRCTKLKTINLTGLSSTGLGDWSFECCVNLQEIFLPENIDFYGKHVFDFCYNLPRYLKDRIKEKSQLIKTVDSESQPKIGQKAIGQSEVEPYSEAKKNFNYGNCYYKSYQYEKAASFYERSANQGYTKAQLAIAKMQIHKEHLFKNIFVLEDWLKNAEKMGSVEATFYLKKIYSDYKDINTHKNIETIYHKLDSIILDSREGLFIRKILEQSSLFKDFRFDDWYNEKGKVQEYLLKLDRTENPEELKADIEKCVININNISKREIERLSRDQAFFDSCRLYKKDISELNSLPAIRDSYIDSLEIDDYATINEISLLFNSLAEKTEISIGTGMDFDTDSGNFGNNCIYNRGKKKYQQNKQITEKIEDLKLDFEKIEKIKDATNDLSEKLDSIFIDEEDSAGFLNNTYNVTADFEKKDTIKIKLPFSYRKFLLFLSDKKVISRNEALAFVKPYNIMLDGIIDSLNDKSFDLFDDTIFEVNNNEIYLNQEYLLKLINQSFSDE